MDLRKPDGFKFLSFITSVSASDPNVRILIDLVLWCRRDQVWIQIGGVCLLCELWIYQFFRNWGWRFINHIPAQFSDGTSQIRSKIHISPLMNQALITGPTRSMIWSLSSKSINSIHALYKLRPPKKCIHEIRSAPNLIVERGGALELATKWDLLEETMVVEFKFVTSLGVREKLHWPEGEQFGHGLVTRKQLDKDFDGKPEGWNFLSLFTSWGLNLEAYLHRYFGSLIFASNRDCQSINDRNRWYILKKN